MPIVLILLGAMLLVTAWNNSFGTLTAALGTDVEGFAPWFLAVGLTAGLGYVPGLKIPSRWLLALVLTVLVLRNYAAVLQGFQTAAGGASGATGASAATGASGGASGAVSPAAAYVANPAQPAITQASIGGSATAGSGPSATATATGASGGASGGAAPLNPLDPNFYLGGFSSAIASAGFGGTA